MKSLIPILVWLFLLPRPGLAQEASVTGSNGKVNCKFTTRGYLKDLQYASFTTRPDSVMYDHLLHNRMNFRLYAGDNFTAGLEIRNRLLAGETLRKTPAYADALGHDRGLVDMSWNLLDGQGMVLNMQVDRAWINWTKGNWDLRLGRQRINWGVNLVWNPNDLFNTLNFVDFDYEERPGTDALRLQYATGSFSSADFVIAPGKDSASHSVAAMYRFHKWQYDFQVLAGWSMTDWVAGAGFAGNLGNAGLKGELSYFLPARHFGDSVSVLVVSFSGDYGFRNGLYLHVSGLFNSSGENQIQNIQQVMASFSGDLTAKNLMPSKWSAFLQVSGNVTPLVRADLAAIYGAGMNLLFIMPSVQFSLSDNIDASLIGQSLYGGSGSKFSNWINFVFLRIKWSF